MIIGTAETVQQAVQSGAEIAARMTEYSAANINVIVKSNVEFVELVRTMSRNWMCFAQEGIERGFDWSRCLLQYRAVSTLYPVHVMTRKSFGLMTRKLSVTESQRSAQFRGTVSRRKPSVASANWAHVA